MKHLSICRWAVCEGIMIFSSLLLLFSCERTINDIAPVSEESDSGFEEIMVRSSSLPLFCNLSAYYLRDATADSMAEDDELLSLESMLDRSGMETFTDDEYSITAIPFLQRYCSGRISITPEQSTYLHGERSFKNMLYLVTTSDRSADTVSHMVATMIPDMECVERMDAKKLSFIDKSEFSGIVLYSALDGTFLESLYFQYAEPTAFAFPVTSEESASMGDDFNGLYITTGRGMADTKAAAKIPQPDEEVRMQIENGGGNGGTSTGPNADIQSSSIDVEYDGSIDPFKYNRGSYIDMPIEEAGPKDKSVYFVKAYVQGNGRVAGCGNYPATTKAKLHAIPDYGSYFYKWTGLGHKQEYVKDIEITVTDNVNITAIFK